MPSARTAFENPELFEQRLSELSARFVNVPPDRVDAEIGAALRILVEAMDVDRCSVTELSPDGQCLEVTHNQGRPGSPPLANGSLAAQFPWFTAQLRKGEILQFDRLPEGFPAEAGPEREYCLRTGLRSQLTIPFRVAGRVIGGIGFAAFHREVTWSPWLVRSLRLVSEVIANAVARRAATSEQLRLREQLAHTGRVNVTGEVVASIAHEVNQPLFAIVSNARAAEQLLAREPPDLGEIGAALEDIVQDANRASAVIARIRSFLQRRPAEHAPLEVNRVVESVQSFLAPELAHRGVTVVLQLADGLPRISGDAVQLQQVLVNLLINGADAMEGVRDRPRRLEVQTGADGSDRIRIDVADQGQGLDAETRGRLFEPFFTTKPNGLGMGLAICRSILETHGGRIEALSRSGSGTTMRVWLPVR